MLLSPTSLPLPTWLASALARAKDHPCRWLALMFPLFLAASAGCASAPQVYGDRARFSPAFQGYVMAPNDGSDDPGKDDAVLLLRDPVAGTKLRCQEDVLQWRELYEDVAADQIHDNHAAIAAAVTSGAFFAPFLAVSPVGGLLLTEAMYTGQALYDALRSANATELLAAAVVFHRRQRFQRATLLIERALAKDSTIGTANSAYLYLGLSYFEQGDQDRARAALNAFVERAAVRDIDGYRKAEATLSTLGLTREPCDSMEPVELHW